ncbi:MAG: hypothetical protein ACP5N9_02730 [Candidatus Bilamarchaeum sp.]
MVSSSKYLGLCAFLLSLLLLGCVSNNPQNSSNNSVDTQNAITKAMCDSAGGHWNSCGSACRGAPEGTACTKQCVQYCECGGIAGFVCPAGFVCTDYLPSPSTPDAMGVCKKTSS